MPGTNFLKTRQALIVTALLVAQAAVFYGLPKERPVNLLSPLASFPTMIGNWTAIQDMPVEKEVLDVLKADATLSRFYARSGQTPAINFFMAFFRSQSTGVSPHSPKNCLPGSGWAVSKSDMLGIQVPGLPEPITVNQYIVSKGDARSLVLYWYQSRNRAVASEYLAKIYLVLDSVRYRRSDTSIVKVTVPVSNNDDDSARAAAVDFLQAGFQRVNDILPQ